MLILLIIVAILTLMIARYAGGYYYRTSKLWGFILLLLACFVFLWSILKIIFSTELWADRPSRALWTGFILSSILFAICLMRRGSCCGNVGCQCGDSGSCDCGTSQLACGCHNRCSCGPSADTTSASSMTSPSMSTGTWATDDLKKIEGIWPVLEKYLHSNGLRTFDDVASASVGHIQSILDQEGDRFRIIDPQTRSEQASLCARGDRSALGALQDRLKAGRK